MDPFEFLQNHGTRTVPNPKYNRKSKRNTESPTIEVPDTKANIPFSVQLANKSLLEGYSINSREADKYREYGLNWNPNEDNDRLLADAQSNFDKAKNAVAQTIVSEIGLGTLRGVTDLFDAIMSVTFKANEDNDYTSAASEKLKEWQEQFREYAPVHVTPGADISNGGLTDFGWWMSNLPSIASSLTLLIPSTGFTKGLSLLGKGLRVQKGIGKARKFLTSIDKVDEAARLSQAGKLGRELTKAEKVAQWANNPNTVQAANRMFEFGINGLTSRVMENYQESNQVYNDLLPELYNGDKASGTQGLKDMNEQDYQALLTRNKDVLQGVDTTDRKEVAKRLAKKAADETFWDDAWNAVFDVYQLYGLRNLKALRNAPMRASVRRDHLNSIKYAGKSKDEITKILDARSKWAKGWEKAKDYAWGSKVAIGAQLSEGVEEAVNYIAQEEGYHYGHVLLGTAQDNNFWDTRLVDYLKAPGLYDSAFWGVMGGVVFHGAGSGLANLKRAIDYKADKKKKAKNETTNEQTPTTPWSEAFESPEIKARRDNIARRLEALNTLKIRLEQIRNKQDPFNKIGENNVELKNETEQEIARQKAYDSYIIDLLTDSMAVGNYNLTKAFLESDEVRDKIVEAGIVSAEQAAQLQERALQLGNELENIYDRNLRAVGNALRGIDKTTGAKYEDIPIEYFQIIAMKNVRAQLEAEQFGRAAAEYQPIADSEEARIADELKASGIDYKAAIRSFILAKQLGEIEAELENARKSIKDVKEKNYDPRTISGQNAIRELELRKRVLTDMLYEEAGIGTEVNEKLNRGAKLLTTLRAVAATETSKDSATGYRMNYNTKRYKELDDAILKAFNSDEANWKNSLTVLNSIAPGFEDFSLEEFRSAAHQADAFSQQIKRALGDNGAIENLSNLSESLLDAYAKITYNQIARNIALSHVNTTRDAILQAANVEHNQMQGIRPIVVESANHILKALAKKYNEELGDISEELAYGTLREDARNFLKEHLSEDDMQTYDAQMRILSLNNANITNRKGNTSALNSLLPEMVKDAIYSSSMDEFEEVDLEALDKQNEEESAEDNEEEKENNLINENQSSASEKSEPIKTSTEESKPKSEATSGKKIDFEHNKKGKSIPARAIVDADRDTNRPTKLRQYGSETTANTLGDVRLVPVKDQTNTYELDYINDIEKGITDITRVPYELFNLKQTFIEGAEITKNPRVVIDDEGNVIDYTPGEATNSESADAVEEAEEAQGEEGSADDASISSTGEESEVNEDNDESDIDGEPPIESFDVPEEVKEADTEYDPENIVADMCDQAILYLQEVVQNGGKVVEADFKARATEMFSEKVDDESFNKAYQVAISTLKEFAEAPEINVEFQPIGEFMQASAIFDSAITGSQEEADARNLMDTAFEQILANFVKHAYVDESTGKKRISLENLLRYCNQVASNKTFGGILYDRFYEILTREEDKYTLVDGYNSKDTIVNNATRSQAEKFDINASVDGRSLDIGSYLYSLRDDEHLEDREKIYDVIDSLENDDTLDIEVAKHYLYFKKDGVTIARIWIPTQNGDHYKATNMCWVHDIPISSDGTKGKIQTLFERIILNPDNEEKLEPLRNALSKLVYRNQYTDVTFEDDCIAFMQELAEAIPQLKDYIDRTDYTSWNPTSKTFDREYTLEEAYYRAAKHLIRVYAHANKATQDWLNMRNMSNEEYADAIKDRRKESVNRWFKKLKDSYDTSTYLYTSGIESVAIDHLYKGGVIITSPDEMYPINDEGVLGSKVKDKVEIGVASIYEPGKIYSTRSGQSYEIANITGGMTFAIIPREQGTPAIIPAYPQPIGSGSLSSAVGQLTDDIFNELNRLLTDWGSDVNITTAAIEKFLNSLCNPSRTKAGRPTNNNLFKGITVTKLTNGFEGINIQYQRDGKWHNIRLFDSNKYGKASNIKIESNKPISCKTKAARVEVMKQLKEILGEVITYNIEFDHVRGSRTTAGYAQRNAKGEFVVTIGEQPARKFKSYRDFVIEGNVVLVRTKSLNGKTNFYRKFSNYNEDGNQVNNKYDQFNDVNISYKVTTEEERLAKKAETSPVKESDTKSKSAAVLDILNKYGTAPNVMGRIADVILSNTQLKFLKDSRILKELLTNNVIFVKDFHAEDAIAAHLPTKRTINGVEVPAGTIVVNQQFMNLLSSTDPLSHEEAFRHLLHETIHRKLTEITKEQRTELFDEIREVFNDFVKANKEEGIDGFDLFYYENDIKVDKKGKPVKDKDDNIVRIYHDKDGKINEKGLEEFLIESLTRPKLIARLNSISVGEGDIQNRTIGNLRAKSLFQRILAAIAKLFDLKINKGSLLEKEYKLFEKVSAFNKQTNQTIDKTTQQKKETPKKESKEKAKAPVQGVIPFTYDDEVKEDESKKDETKKNGEEKEQSIQPTTNNKYNMGSSDIAELDDLGFSSIFDSDIASLASVRDGIVSENRQTFEQFVKNGIISIKC